MKVLRITNLPTKDFPGSGLTSQEVTRGTEEKLVITFRKDLLLYDINKDSIVLDFKYDLRVKRNIFKRALLFLYFNFKVAKKIRAIYPDVIHMHWIPNLLLFLFFTKKNNQKVFLTVHGQDAKLIKSPLFKILAKRIDKIFVVGKFWKDELLKDGLDAIEIPNFSPIDSKSISELKNTSTHLPNSLEKLANKNFCIIASDKDHKNLGIFSKMPSEFLLSLKSNEFSIKFIGVSNAYLLRQIGSEIFDYVDCLGRLGRKETLQELSQSDFLILPSFTEGNPKVFWEAAALEKKVIISETVEFLGFKSQDYPYKFDPNNPNELWELIKFFKNSPESLEELESYTRDSGASNVRNTYYQYYQYSSNGKP